MRVLLVLTAGMICMTVLAGCEAAVSPEARNFLQAADAAFRRGDDPAAVEASSRFIRMHPRAEETSEAYYIRALARCRAGKIGPAREELLAALGLARRKDLIALIRCRLGDFDYQAGDMNGAARHYRAVLEQIPPGASPADEAMYRLGCVLQRQGRWRDADVLFSRVRHFFDDTPFAARAAARAHAVRWSIQAGAMGEADSAEKLQRRLRLTGLKARTDLDLRDGRVMRLVRVGSYHTHSQARADLGDVRKIVQDAFITPAR